MTFNSVGFLSSSFLIIMSLFSLVLHAGQFRKAVRAVDTYLDIGLSQRQSCPAIRKIQGIEEVDILLEKAHFYKANYQACEAVNYFYSAYTQKESHLEKISEKDFQKVEYALFKMVESYLQVRERIFAINELNQFMKRSGLLEDSYKNSSPQSLLKEKIRYEIIYIAHLALQDSEEKEKLNWSRLLMGIHPDQTSENSLLQGFVVQIFLEEYPESQHQKTLLRFKSNARKVVSESYIQEALLHRIKKEYKSAIEKLMIILRWGPSNEAFSEGLRELKLTLEEYQMAVLDSGLLSSEKISKELGLSPQEITEDLRFNLSQKATEQLQKIAQIQ